MKIFIKQNVIQRILEDGKLRMKLALALEVGERAVWISANRLSKENAPNSSFTKLPAIFCLRKEGLKDDEIFYIEQAD